MKKLISIALCSFIFTVFFNLSHAGSPIYSVTALTASNLTVPSNSTAEVQYTVTNNTSKSRTLIMKSITGVTQSVVGAGVCQNPFTLSQNQSCRLVLTIDGSVLAAAASPFINTGPVICKTQSNVNYTPDLFLCSQPSLSDSLNIKVGAPLVSATIAVLNSPLKLAINGNPGTLTIQNTSSQVTATNINANLTGALATAGVIQSATTCISVAPGATCTLSFTPGASTVAQTSFPISGDNTNSVSGEIIVKGSIATLTSLSPLFGPTAGGTFVTLTGTNLIGTSAVTFGGAPASNINVVNSTTVTAITPTGSVGYVDVAITTPDDTATLSQGYLYADVGATFAGGKVACLGGTPYLNFVVATTNTSNALPWGLSPLTTNATSSSNGASNTTLIINTPGQISNTAAAACDSLSLNGYDDWFLPAIDQLSCINSNRVAIGGFTNGNAYWSSSEVTGGVARYLQIGSTSSTSNKNVNNNVRCIRVF